MPPAAAAPSRPQEEPAERVGRRGRVAGWRLHLLAPAALTLWLSFRAGGFFAGITGLTAAVLGVALAVYVTVAPRPFAGVSAWGLVSAAGLVAFAAWILISLRWAGAPGGGDLEVHPRPASL